MNLLFTFVTTDPGFTPEELLSGNVLYRAKKCGLVLVEFLVQTQAIEDSISKVSRSMSSYVSGRDGQQYDVRMSDFNDNLIVVFQTAPLPVNRDNFALLADFEVTVELPEVGLVESVSKRLALQEMTLKKNDRGLFNLSFRTQQPLRELNQALSAWELKAAYSVTDTHPTIGVL